MVSGNELAFILISVVTVTLV